MFVAHGFVHYNPEAAAKQRVSYTPEIDCKPM